MPLRTLHEAKGLVFRDDGAPTLPALVYLPGVHGCWTPLGPARAALLERFRLIEIAYAPRPDWALGDYARALEALLGELGLGAAHLVGESFGSLIGWELGLARPRALRSLLLIGGFCRAPGLRRAAIARLALRAVPTRWFGAVVDRYVDYRAIEIAHVHDRKAGAYPAVRTRAGRLATARRMALIQESDFRARLPEVDFPVRYLGGVADTVVPVAREAATLARLLPARAGFESTLVARAPHMIIASHPALCVDWLESSVAAIERASARGKRWRAELPDRRPLQRGDGPGRRRLDSPSAR